MAEQIQIEVTLDGAEQAARGAENVASGLEDMARSGVQTAQRIQGVAGAVQGLVSQLGSSNRTAGLVASVASTTVQFAQLGSMLGPMGTLVGGLTGLAAAATSAAFSFGEVNVEIARSAAALRESEGNFASTASSIRSIGSAADEAMARLGEMLRTATEAESFVPEWISDPGRAARERQQEFLRERERRRREGSRGGGGGGTREPSLEDLMANALGTGARTRFVETLEGIADEYESQLDEIRALNEEFDAAELQRAQELKDEQVRLLEERTAAEEAEREKRQAIAEEENESRTKLAEANEARASEMMENFGSLASGSSKLITSALIDTISGAKTAEEAFTGMLKSFLEMISEYAALKAATEFAEAIGSFARYDFSGGAQHVAAGLAFTAVAVATGVGAAAINTGAPAAPARPATGGGEGRGGEKQTVVVNYNSPVVTAQTEAELGRSIGGMVDTGRRRFGS